MKIKIPKDLQKLMPLWSEKFKTRKNWKQMKRKCEIKGVILDIDRLDCCIVGEVLDLTSHVTFETLGNTCNMCKEYADKFVVAFGDKKRLEWLLIFYEEHIKEYHGDLMQ